MALNKYEETMSKYNQADEIKKFRASMPERYRKSYDKALKGSLRAGINSKCLDCTNWQKEEIKHCQVLACPLFNVRPYNPAKKARKSAQLGNIERI